MTLPILGIDISKSKFHVALLQEQGKPRSAKFDNNEAGFEALVQWLEQHGVKHLHACLEATSTYGNALARYLHGLGHRVSIVNPARIKGFMQSQLRRTKNDRADATAIAHFCQVHQPSAWTPLPPAVEQLQQLTRRLQALASMIAQEKNRLETATEAVIPLIQHHIKFLQTERKTLQQLIEQHLKAEATLKAQRTLLLSIPAIGPITAAIVLAELGDFCRFENVRQAAAYGGLTPQERQSGSSVQGKPRMCKIGNARLRQALFMPSLSAIRCNPIIRAFYERLLAAGKSKMTAIGAAMHKLLRLAYGVLKSGQPFDPNWAVPAPPA
jgi:transposase